MAAVAVVVAVLAALTLLPAVLAIIGPHINSLRVRHPQPESSRSHEGLWAKWAHEIARYPVVAGAGRAGDPDPADDPAAVAEPRPAGHRRAVAVDDSAQSLRPARQQLRRRHQRPADRRRHARLARQGAGRRRLIGREQVRLVAARPARASPRRRARSRRPPVGRLRRRAPAADRPAPRARRARRARRLRRRNRRATRVPPIRVCRRCRRTSRTTAGVVRGHADPDRQGRHDGVLQRDLARRARPKKRRPTSSKSCARA